ncbi:MAG TPA: hypothetical protein VK821_01370 [Dehalococcoidia bacterium]|nr:hypothetical protein [Dehalococcoidia bacterium]
MTNPTTPDAALDGILRRARHLLLDFNGPVCTLYAHQPEHLAADHLRAILAEHAAEIPENIATTSDPLTVLAYAAATSPELAGRAEAELTRYELSAVATAQPIASSHDLISSARESHRTITVISSCSAQAVRAYLDRASLDEQVGLVIGRKEQDPDSATEHDLIDRALTALNADLATCVVVAESQDILDSASAHSIATIAYARSAADDRGPAQAAAAIASLANLVLRLRAHPLPN